MGNMLGKEQIKRSPPRMYFSTLQRHWGAPQWEGSMDKKTLIKYCTQQWLLYKLEDGENGSINYNTLLQLTLFLRREGKWDKIVYEDLFFVLCEHPEMQKGCAINLAPRDPLVLTLEKDNFKAGVGKMKKGCSSCSIGSRCLKYKEDKDRIEDSVTPMGAWGRGQQEQEQAGSPLPLEEPEVTPLSPPPSPEIKRGRKKEPDTEKRRHSFRHPSSSPPKTRA